LRSKAQKLDVWRSSQQLCRYLYYLGRIRAVQLDYTDAKDCLQQAARKVTHPYAKISRRCNLELKKVEGKLISRVGLFVTRSFHQMPVVCSKQLARRLIDTSRHLRKIRRRFGKKKSQ
jgi:hypothetical protein